MLRGVWVAVVLVACGPSRADRDAPGIATLTGTVWAPNQTSAIPIAGALVYVSAVRPQPIPTPFQTASTAHPGLDPQERVLLYLIMEITTCSDHPIP